MIIPPEDLAGFLGRIYPFHKKNIHILELVISGLEFRNVNGGDLVFRAGERAQTFLLLYQGDIQLSSSLDADTGNRIKLKRGDWLGYEALDTESTYRGNAWAGEGGAVIICFSKQLIEHLILEYNWFQEAVSIMKTSFQLASRIRLKWLGEGEVLYFVARQHPWYLVLKMIAPLITGCILMFFLSGINTLFTANQTITISLFTILLLFVSAWLGWNILDWANDYVMITDRRVAYQKKVLMLYDSRQEVPLNMILAVNIETDQWGRLLGYGNVVVRTYAGVVELPRLRSPRQVASMVEAQGYRSSLQRSESEKQNIQSILRKRYKIVEGEVDPKEEVIPYVQPGNLQILMNNLFRMRFERGDVIIYRTHWSLLLARLFLPSFFFIALCIAWAARAAGGIQVWSMGLFTGISLVVGSALAGWWLYQYVDWRNDIYVINDEQIMDINKKPLGREETRSALLKNIQSIEFSQKWLTALLFNYGTVSIRVGDTLFTFDDVYDPSEVQRELANRITEREYYDQQSELEGQYERMADFMEAYQGVMDEKAKNPDSEPMRSKPGQDDAKVN